MTRPDHKYNNDDGSPPPPPETPKFEKLRKVFGQGEASVMAQASAVGITFAVAIVLGLALGWWLDRRLGTAPWLLLGGLMLGIAAGFKNLFTVSARIEKLEQRRAEEKKRRLGSWLPPDKK